MQFCNDNKMNKKWMKWCKNIGNFSLLEDDWTPRVAEEFQTKNGQGGVRKCNLTHHHNDTFPNGQWIQEVGQRDGQFFNCFNRNDEDPFIEAKGKNGTTKDTWLDTVHSPTSIKSVRRCLGERPDDVSHCACKF